MRPLLLLVLFAVPSILVKGQDQPPQTRALVVFLGGGAATGQLYNGPSMSFGFNISFEKTNRHYAHVVWSGYDPNPFLNPDGTWELSIMYGYGVKRNQTGFNIDAQVGPSFMAVDEYPTLGAEFNTAVTYKPHWHIGIGIEASGNLNEYNNYASVRLVLSMHLYNKE